MTDPKEPNLDNEESASDEEIKSFGNRLNSIPNKLKICIHTVQNILDIYNATASNPNLSIDDKLKIEEDAFQCLEMLSSLTSIWQKLENLLNEMDIPSKPTKSQLKNFNTSLDEIIEDLNSSSYWEFIATLDLDESDGGTSEES